MLLMSLLDYFLLFSWFLFHLSLFLSCVKRFPLLGLPTAIPIEYLEHQVSNIIIISTFLLLLSLDFLSPHVSALFMCIPLTFLFISRPPRLLLVVLLST